MRRLDIAGLDGYLSALYLGQCGRDISARVEVTTGMAHLAEFRYRPGQERSRAREFDCAIPGALRPRAQVHRAIHRIQV